VEDNILGRFKASSP